MKIKDKVVDECAFIVRFSLRQFLLIHLDMLYLHGLHCAAAVWYARLYCLSD